MRTLIGRRLLGFGLKRNGILLRVSSRSYITSSSGSSSSRSKKGGLFLASATGMLLSTAGYVHCDVDASVLKECDDLFETRGKGGSLLRAYELLEKTYATNENAADRVELCYRLARAAYNLLSSTDPEDKVTGEMKKTLASKALEFAEEARKVAPNDFKSHYWCGIAIQAYGDHVGGTKYTLERLVDIRSSFEMAAQLNPRDGTTQYCLGAWCYSLSDLGWMSRKLASTLFATPPTSTFEEGLAFFLNAENVEPGFWNKNPLMIAKSYYKLDNREEAARWALETINRPCATPEDEQFKKEAEALYKRVN